MIWLLACRPAPEPLATDAIARLHRLSIDLRGVRPTLEEIAAVEADPEAVDAAIDPFLYDERFEGRAMEAFQRVFRTRTESYLVFDALRVDDPDGLVRAIGEEPIRFAARVAAEDRPYTDLLTADWTVVDEHLAAIYPTDYPAGATGWQVARYTDGRPAAGLLGTNGFWWRYPSTPSNKNRKRANQVRRIFACADFLSTEVPFDPNVNLLDEDALEDAIVTNPSCSACHAALDPIASALWGYYYRYDDGIHTADASVYHPEHERRWETETGAAPAWFGQPVNGISGLAAQVIADDNFVPCAAQSAFVQLVGRTPSIEEREPHERAFAQGGFTVRALWASVVRDAAYDPGALQWLPPDRFASVVEDLTGYRMRREDVDLLGSDLDGVLTLAGGADGQIVTDPLATPSTTAQLVYDRVASAAGMYAATVDDRLLPRVDGTETPETDRAAIVAQLQDLFLRLHGRVVAADGPEVAGQLELFAEVRALEGRTDQAWAAVIASMLRSPDFLLY